MNHTVHTEARINIRYTYVEPRYEHQHRSPKFETLFTKVLFVEATQRS